MKTRLVHRYYCDFCKKSGCSAYHIRRHEERCTLNPARRCGLCYDDRTTPEELAEAVAGIPDLKRFERTTRDGWSWVDVPDVTADAVLADLERRFEGCPVCMYAALRQAGWAGVMRSKFDLKQLTADYWNDVNQTEERASYGY